MEIESEEIPPTNAVSLYGESNDAMDDFPILKAFQQYVDNEQSKARKRMYLLCALFAFILTMVVSVFSVMIVNLNERNQTLNDRLVDFAMKDRQQAPSAPVVVQPSQDNSMVMALSAKLESLQQMIIEQNKAKAEKTADETPKSVAPSAEQIELENKLKAQQQKIEKATALLKAQKEQIEAEKAKLREQELEAYRRKYYPEFYEKEVKKAQKAQKPTTRKVIKPIKKVEIIEDIDVDDEEIDDIDLDDVDIDDDEFEDYYDEEDEEEIDEDYEIPVDTKKSSWRIPRE